MLSTKISRIGLVLTTIMALFATTASVSAVASGGVLLGKWNHVKMVQTADAQIVRVQESAGESSVEYKEDGTWVFRSPRNNNSGTYRLTNGVSLETTILQSDIRSQVGWRSVKQIEIEGNTLLITTKYDAKAMEVFARRSDGTRPKEMIVISTFKRVGGK